ncbi:MAG: FapA family protein [Treponema sp.]|nr:FapA family protein [Treponema sp.]
MTVEESIGSASPERQTVLYGGMNDGTMEVTFTENALELYADFHPPILNGRPLDGEAVQAMLERINVVFGIRWDDINTALQACNANRQKIKDVLVARGDVSEVEIAEYYEMSSILEKAAHVVDSRERINYRERSPFVIVKKGQVLAKLRPRKPGKEGTNVRGESLPFGINHPAGVIGGENTVTEPDKITAAIHGQLVERGNELSVQEHLIIKGAVGYGTGNIVFPGDVKIDGPVSDGFKIYSGGSLAIKQTLDLTEVVTKGDIHVAGGIIGKGSALIKCGGGIKTKFIENCHVASRGTVYIDTEIINSSIFSMDTVRMGEKGMILGSEIYAVHGLRAGRIGKKGAGTTRIHCGVDFSVQQEKEKYNNQLRILAAKLAKLRELMADPEIEDDKKAKMDELLRRLEGEQQEASNKISELMGSINADEKAVVEVMGEIAPGTLIEICQVALFVEEPLRKVRISLDTSGGKLVPGQL